MSTRALLDTDMNTLARLARSGLRWWIDELREVFPVRAARVPADGLTCFNGTAFPPGSRIGMSETIALDPDLCLVRTREQPLMSQRDFARLIELDHDRLMPSPQAELLVVGQIRARDSMLKRMQVIIVALDVGVARRLAGLLEDAKVVPRAIVVPCGESTAIDLLPAFQSRGLIATGRRRDWWLAVLALLFVNVALVAWRDEADIAQLKAHVDGQRPVLEIAQRLRQRLKHDDALVVQSLRLRREHDALAAMGDVARVLPAQVALQRLGIERGKLHLTGFTADIGAVVSSIRSIPYLTEVQTRTPDGATALPIGEPFEITADIRATR